MQAVLLSRFFLDLSEESTKSDSDGGSEASSSGPLSSDLQFARVLGTLGNSISCALENPSQEAMEMYSASDPVSEDRDVQCNV